VPHDKRSKPTLAYVGSLGDATMEVDMSTLHIPDYVRVRIAAMEVSKIPIVAEGAIIPYLYDFHYEREVEQGMPKTVSTIQVPADNEPSHPLAKKPGTDVTPPSDKDIFVARIMLKDS
jgi:hypothetical protein